jgi:hypothetical protein
MKKSELKDYIKEIILAELTVTSDKDTAKKLTDQGLSVTFDPKAKPVSESEDEEPTQADIQKEKSLTKAQTEWAKITKELKSNVSKIKDIISKKPADRTKADEDLLTKMKELTKRKNQLKSKFSELDDEN